MLTDPRLYMHGQLRNERHIDACRWNNLVYVRTLKCGSEFFCKNFTITAGWTPISFQDIDWNHDTVFSYIMDPIQRRHKGIGEFLLAQGAKELLLHNDIFGHVISQVPCFDEHSACLRDLYGAYLDKINWIPMDGKNHYLSIDITDKLLETHKCPAILWNYSYEHTTENYLGEMYNRIVALWREDPSIQQITLFYFKEDIELFNTVKEKYAAGN